MSTRFLDFTNKVKKFFFKMSKDDVPKKSIKVTSSPVGNERVSVTENPGPKITTVCLMMTTTCHNLSRRHSGSKVGQSLGMWMVQSRFLVKKILLMASQRLIIIW